MSTQQTAKTQYVQVKGTKYAYRYFGLSSGIPLVFLQHFRGTMDHWDPAVINPLAKSRPVLLLDNSGVGKSSGTVPDNFVDWAVNVVDVVEALGIKQIDLLGFSMGSLAAQMVALNTPHLVRRLILAASVPSRGEGVEGGAAWAFETLATAATPEEQKAGFLKTFYTQGEEKLALGEQWWDRMNERSEDRSDYLGPEGTQQQLVAATKWATGEPGGSFDRLAELRMPVFVASGDNDIIAPTANSIVLWRKIKTAHLHIYPDVGHGFLNEYAEMFSEHVKLFLDTEKVM